MLKKKKKHSGWFILNHLVVIQKNNSLLETSFMNSHIALGQMLRACCPNSVDCTRADTVYTRWRFAQCLHTLPKQWSVNRNVAAELMRSTNHLLPHLREIQNYALKCFCQKTNPLIRVKWKPNLMYKIKI